MIEYAWISKLLRDTAFTWRPRELSWLISILGVFAIRSVIVLEIVICSSVFWLSVTWNVRKARWWSKIKAFWPLIVVARTPSPLVITSLVIYSLFWQTDLHLHCREWDDLLDNGDWNPEMIAETLPKFFRFVKKVQAIVLEGEGKMH